MNELIEYAETIISYLETNGSNLNIESQHALGEFLQNIFQIIEMQAEQQSPVEGLQPQTPQLEPGPFESSNVNSFKYNPINQQLYVKFHGKDNAESGPTYLYEGIPKNIYDVFSRGGVGPKTSGQNQYHRWIKGVTPSLGASLNALIKNGGYGYSRIS